MPFGASKNRLKTGTENPGDATANAASYRLFWTLITGKLTAKLCSVGNVVVHAFAGVKTEIVRHPNATYLTYIITMRR
jgi:hypothetical protein